MKSRMKGAEAIVRKTRFLSQDCVIKNRIKKNYRIGELDGILRKRRTKAEARLLNRAKMAGVPCPTVLFVDDFSITMTFVKGTRPAMNRKQAKRAGEYLAMLHNNEIVHGDYTPANLIESRGGIYVIDFGLGFFSADVEDFAVDVFTMIKGLGRKNHRCFLEGYKKCRRYKEVLKRAEAITMRMRYGGSDLLGGKSRSLGMQSL